MTLDELIDRLKQLREEHNGSKEVVDLGLSGNSGWIQLDYVTEEL